jgi:hypothetical protein
VQGGQRLLLEQYRRQARSQAATVDAEVARQRAEQMSARDAGAYREKVVIPLEELFRPGGPQTLSAEEAARRAAVLQPARGAPTTEPAEIPSAAPAVAPGDDPFRDDAARPAREPVPPPSSEASPPAEAAPIDEDADDNPFDF